MCAAGQPPAKRARTEVEVPSFASVDLSQFTLKDKGEGKNGGRLAFPFVAAEPIRFNLTPTGWLESPFGFDTACKFKKPSFLGGPEPEAGIPEGLELRIDLPQTEAEFLSQLDEKCRDAFEQHVKVAWSPLVGENSLFQTKWGRVTVILKGDGLTRMAVVADNKVVRGEGWDFLKTYIEKGNTFRRAEIKLTVRVKKLWHVEGKAGIKLEATQLVLRAQERREADAFADDAELLA